MNPTASITAPPAESATQADLTRTFKGLSLAALFAVLLLSIVEILGWALNIEVIKHPWPGQRAMLSSFAFNFLFASTGALLMLYVPTPAIAPWFGRAFAAVVLLAGGLNLADHLLNTDLGLDYVLWQPSEDSAPLTYPGPMTPDVALAFIATGAALLLFTLRARNITLPAQALLILLAANSIAIIACYAFGHDNLCAYFGCIKFSAITSATFALLASGVLFSRVEQGFTSILVSTRMGGVIARRILVGCIGALPVIAAIHAGQTSGLYDEGIALGLSIGMLICFIAGVVLWEVKKVETVVEEKEMLERTWRDTLASMSGAHKRVKLVCTQCGTEVPEGTTTCPSDGAEVIPMKIELAPGTAFLERYEIIDRLGSGGMSAVFKARHCILDKTVAIKILHSHLATNLKDIRRFQQEGKAVTQLSHPNILTVHDSGVSPEGDPYMVMDLLEGTSLSDLLDEVGILSPRQAVPLFIQICEGMQHAYEQGIWHRDLKPGNVMIVTGEDGCSHAKIVDFGLAKLVEEQDRQRLTSTGELLGSPAYLAPERCAGLSYDHRADIYSIGCLMYETLSGLPPLMGDNPLGTIMKQVTEAPQKFEDDLKIPEALEAVVLKALEKDPAKRQQSFQELADELRVAFPQVS